MAKVITLQENQNHENLLFQVKKHDVVRFIPGSSLFKYDTITIYTNYTDNSKEFARDTYKKLTVNRNSMSWGSELHVKTSGSFHYYYTAGKERLGTGYLLVLPSINVQIRCQTVISKNLGTFDTWPSRLDVTYESNYNMIHFTPIQELGGSQSAYSIKDQLALNSSFTPPKSLFGSSAPTFEKIGELLKDLKEKRNVYSITDIVLNHTSNDSEWLKSSPESAYNCSNSPHLRPAFLVDRAILALSLDLAHNRWAKTHGLTNQIKDERDLSHIRILLKTFYLANLRLHELFQVNVEDAVQGFSPEKIDLEASHLTIVQDPKYRRLKSKVGSQGPYTDVHQFRQALLIENVKIANMIRSHLFAAVENVISAIRYERLDSKGPKVPLVTPETPVVWCYFKSPLYKSDRVYIKAEENTMYDENLGKMIWVHNGWVMNSNVDFAASTSNVYLRRELIVWGDSVKLYYGQQPSDSPKLWKRMRQYVEHQARLFHGLRLDNCHSTPIHVAEHMLDAARRVNNDLFLIAELFTSNEDVDNMYVNRLGLSALVREAMSAHTARDLGSLIYRFGGEAIGAYFGSLRDNSRPLAPRVAPAMFYDATHDNESPVVRRSAYDLQATSAVVSMACCSSGSNRGYDEIVPHHINVVTEKRLYAPWSSSVTLTNGSTNSKNGSAFDSLRRKSKSNIASPAVERTICVTPETGIIPLRRLINSLQDELIGHDELFVDQVDDNVIAITRHNPNDCTSIIVVARTAFEPVYSPDSVGAPIRSIFVPGQVRRILFESRMQGDPSKYERHESIINGLSDFRSIVIKPKKIEDCQLVRIKPNANNDEFEVEFSNFVPSSVLAFEVGPTEKQTQAIQQINAWTQDAQSKLANIIKSFTLADINFILFRCQREKAAPNFDDFVYELPNYRQLEYSGLASVEFILRKVREHQDQAHPLSANLRDGHWLSDYVINRLQVRESCVPLAQHLKPTYDAVKCLPRALKPKFFDLISRFIYEFCVEHALSLMNPFVSNGIQPLKQLALGTLALVGESCDAPLAPLVNASKAPLVSIAAGLPHFAEGFMRIWGRDTFIALRGLLLLTGRYDDAQNIILSFAGAMRHGLIPNLLDGGHKARFNCRDAVWWWLHCIKEYVTVVPDGHKILHQPVCCLFRERTESDGYATLKLHEVMQDALEKHVQGIDFVEHNAGEHLDAHMRQEGFHVVAGICKNTGFVYGGNAWNCGTWMDKMGSSDKAGTRGKPATPRDGSAVELVGLSYAVVKWLASARSKKIYPHAGVTFTSHDETSTKWSWNDWAQLIQSNFQSKFFIDSETKSEHVNRRHIYKDTVGASFDWADYQFRPNFLVAMSVAPELFDKSAACQALEMAKNVLVGPLGMKTLDPTDWNYSGNYNNDDDTDHAKTAHGYNYHQGPEWLWLSGYYMIATLKFARTFDNIEHIKRFLANHFDAVEASPWYGLPELTNANGAHCPFSCGTQAWSLGTIIEAVYELQLGR